MAKFVRDILVNVGSGDLRFSAGDIISHLYFDILWGSLFNDDGEELYANVLIPSRHFNKLVADEDGRCLVYANTPYCPDTRTFTVRLILLNNDNSYSKIEQSNCDFPVLSESLMGASELPSVDVDGNFVFQLKDNVANVYSANHTDFLIGGSDLQSSQLLTICGPGKYYRYPTTGIDTTGFIGSVVSYTDLGDRISEQFENNGISVQEADFNSGTGELQIVFFNEEIEDSDGLLPIDQLDLSSLDITDEMLGGANLDDCDGDYYDGLIPDIEVPEIIASCFGNGVWMGRMPWTGDVKWKGQKTY